MLVPAPRPTTPTRFSPTAPKAVKPLSLPTAHRLIALAGVGHPVGAAAVNATIDGADGGSVPHIQNGNVLSMAQALQIRAKYVGKWRGQAAAQAILYPRQVAL